MEYYPAIESMPMHIFITCRNVYNNSNREVYKINFQIFFKKDDTLRRKVLRQ